MRKRSQVFATKVWTWYDSYIIVQLADIWPQNVIADEFEVHVQIR